MHSKVDIAKVQLSLERCASVRFRNIMGPDSSIEMKRVAAQHDFQGVPSGAAAGWAARRCRRRCLYLRTWTHPGHQEWQGAC
jgi:hypothetical protein